MRWSDENCCSTDSEVPKAEGVDILQRIEDGENQQTEFKRGLGDLSAVGRAICAFANAAGGVIILGVTDSLKIVGVQENAEHAHDRLTSFLQTGCSTPVSTRTGRHEDSSGWVLGWKSRASGGSSRCVTTGKIAIFFPGQRFVTMSSDAGYGPKRAAGSTEDRD